MQSFEGVIVEDGSGEGVKERSSKSDSPFYQGVLDFRLLTLIRNWLFVKGLFLSLAMLWIFLYQMKILILILCMLFLLDLIEKPKFLIGCCIRWIN